MCEFDILRICLHSSYLIPVYVTVRVGVNEIADVFSTAGKSDRRKIYQFYLLISKEELKTRIEPGYEPFSTIGNPTTMQHITL